MGLSAAAAAAARAVLMDALFSVGRASRLDNVTFVVRQRDHFHFSYCHVRGCGSSAGLRGIMLSLLFIKVKKMIYVCVCVFSVERRRGHSETHEKSTCAPDDWEEEEGKGGPWC